MDNQMNTSWFRLVLTAAHIANRCLGLEATCCQQTSQLFTFRHFRQTFKSHCLTWCNQNHRCIGASNRPSLELGFWSPAVTGAAQITRHSCKFIQAAELCPELAGPLSSSVHTLKGDINDLQL